MKWALITGATGGLGGALSRRLAADGRSLVVSGRDVDRLRTMAAELRETHGVSVHEVPADLATDKGLNALRSITEPVDLVVICGADYHFGAVSELSEAAFERLTTCNAQNTGRLIRWALRALEPTSGSLLVVGSLGTILPAPQHASYSASKAWLHQFVRSIQAEQSQDSVRITLGIPGGMATPMLLDSPAWVALRHNPLARLSLMQPEWVAERFLEAVHRGRPVVIPGILNRWAQRVACWLPLAARMWIARRFYAVEPSQPAAIR